MFWFVGGIGFKPLSTPIFSKFKMDTKVIFIGHEDNLYLKDGRREWEVYWNISLRSIKAFPMVFLNSYLKNFKYIIICDS